MKMKSLVMQQIKTDWPTTARLHQFIAKLFLFLFIILEWLHLFGKYSNHCTQIIVLKSHRGNYLRTIWISDYRFYKFYYLKIPEINSISTLIDSFVVINMIGYIADNESVHLVSQILMWRFRIRKIVTMGNLTG